MTSLSGIRILNEGQDRLFDPLHRVVIIADCIGIALMAIKSGGRFEVKGNYGTFSCSAFPVDIKFPLVMASAALAEGSPLTQIAFEFGASVNQPVPPGKTRTTVPNFGHYVLRAITPVYVDFYERHRRWIQRRFGKHDVAQWPPLFNFARMMRNFISHHEGHVNFEKQTSIPVTWHHLTYSPSDAGKQVLGTDINIGDMVALLFEIGDELDRLGCPLKP